MTEQYKLHYLNARGIAEPIRFILALAEVPFEDKRYCDLAEWKANTPSTRWDGLPFLSIGDDEGLSQPNTIGRYIAHKYNLAGIDLFEQARTDEIVDAIGDLRREYIDKVFSETDEALQVTLQKNYIDVTLRSFLEKLTVVKEANGGKWLVGNNVTWADIHLSISVHVEDEFDLDFYKAFPAIKRVQESVYELPQIKAWIAKRPQTAW